MKRCSVKVAAVGLSTIALASTATFPVYAQAPEESESLVLVPEENIEVQESNSEQEAVTEATEVAKTIDTLEPVEDAVTEEDIPDIQDTVEATENIKKAEEAMEESEAAVEEASEGAVAVTEEIKADTEQAAQVAEEASIAVSDENTTEQEAEAIISDAEVTVEQAEADFDTATEAYNKKLEEYQAAKDDYETAVAAYNSNKDKAIEDLSKASESLDAAQARLSDMEKQLDAAKNELVNAGANAIIAADDNKETDVTSYVASVVQYYYAPKMLLSEGESIADFTVEGTADDYVTISYSVYNSSGEFVRSTRADYGYEVDATTGEIRIYDNRLVYTYTNASGETVELSKEEAEKLSDGMIAIDSYWTATGFYIPRYQSSYNYKGQIDAYGYSDAKAIAQGEAAAEKAFSDNSKYYNSDATFTNGTRTSNSFWQQYQLDINYRVTYDKVVYEQFKISKAMPSYQEMVASKNSSGAIVLSTEDEYARGIIRYINGYEVSEAVKSGKYESYSEAIEAINAEALRKSGVVGVDYTNSTGLNIVKQFDYAAVEKAYKNVFTSYSQDYSSYLANLRATLANYSEMQKKVSSAKEEYAKAGEKVASLKEQIAKLDAANEIDTAAKLARLSAELEKAEANYSQAKENLENAKASLAEAKATFDSRFNISDDSDSANTGSYITPVQELVPKPELITSIEEIKVEEIDADSDSSSDDSSDSSAEETTEEAEEQPVIKEPTEETTIPEEEPPLGVTIAGLLARGKWFVGLAGISSAGVGVAVIEAKRRAAIKIIDKLSQ